jgi:hypothetical protein
MKKILFPLPFIALLFLASCAGTRLLFYFAHSYMAKEVSQFIGLKDIDRENIEKDFKIYKEGKLLKLLNNINEDCLNLIKFNHIIENSKSKGKYYTKFGLIYESIAQNLLVFQEDMIVIVSPYVAKLNKKQQDILMKNLEKAFDQSKVAKFENERKFNKYKRNKIESRLKFFLGDFSKDQKHNLKTYGQKFIISKENQLKWQNQFKKSLSLLYEKLDKNNKSNLSLFKNLLYSWAISKDHDPTFKERRAKIKEYFFELLVSLNQIQRKLLLKKLDKVHNVLKSLTSS